MGLYGDQVLPRMMDVLLGRAMEPTRARVAGGLAGEVPEVGFGSGRNVPHLGTRSAITLAEHPRMLCQQRPHRRLDRIGQPWPRPPLDVPGAISVTAGVALLVLAVTRAGDTLDATRPALLAAAAIVLLGAFVARERTAPAPLLDLALLRDRGIAGANLTLIAVGAFSAGQVLLVTLYLQQGRGLSPVLTGLCLVPQAAGAPLSAWRSCPRRW